MEKDALSGITVRIAGMAESETLTGTTGSYSFTGLRAGKYTVEITGFDDEDVGFSATSSSADLDVGESQVVTFEGTYLRASSIMGQVSIEGTGLADVTVSLQGKGETREIPTNGAGQYLFEDLRRGDYAIGISGFDDDEYGFDVTSKSIHVPYGETENVPFEGIALRTAEIRGTVAIDGMGPLEGVTVSLTGKGDDPDPVVTMGNGLFSFDRLHAGDYTISIFGYDTDEYGFDVTSQNVTVALKETATLEFDGIMLRTAAIEGMVTIKGDGLGGVTVTVAGGPKDETHEATTNSAGTYDVGDLHAGDYSVTITGYDTREYGFEVTTKSVSVGLRETADVAFDGILLRTAGVSGRVTVGDEPMSGWTVALSGEEDRDGVKTNANGQYAFSGLAAGDYTLTLSGYDAYEYEFEAEMEIELELDEAGIANFMGRSLRTVVVMGTVSAEGDGIMGVGVTLTKVLGANSGEILGAMITDEDGGYMFGELLTGIYRIDLGETDNELDFATKNRMGSVATDETATWNFDADIIRTASVGGMVTVDGDGMGDVMVMLTGDHGADEEMETDSDGSYMFDGLRRGDYTVSIMNPDEDMYDFPATERMVSLAVGQAQMDISFAGSMLRRASISGQVHVEGMGLEGVMVTLDGDADSETMTDANGEYNFPGLAGGDYEIEIENPNEDAYIFDVTEVDVDDLGDEEAQIVDFEGEHTRTASISGMLFADEVTVDSMYTEGEPMLPFDSFPLLLQGPGLDQATLGATDSTGMYSFDGLKAGTYNVVIDITEEIEAHLAGAGYAFSGNEFNIGITVPAATDVDLDLPFRITKQTIYVGAFLSAAGVTGYPVGGVRLGLYPTAEDASDGTNSLGVENTKGGAPDNPGTGFATFEFDRADDKGPGGSGIDYLVYVKVLSVSNRDLSVHDDALIEIEYRAVDRATLVPTAVKLINTRVNFQWWVKSNEDANDGNEFLGGWKATNGSVTNSRGLATYTGTVSAAQRTAMIRGTPAEFKVSLDSDQADSVDMKELWRASGTLTHVHTGMENPSDNTMANNDLTAIYVTWRTHTLVLGVYREADDVDGYTDYQSGLPGGDHRPVKDVADEMDIDLMARDDRDRLKVYEYDHDACTNTNSGNTPKKKAEDIKFTNGLAKVTCLPANDEFTIKFELGDDRVEVGAAERLNGYIEAYNSRDLSVGGTVVGTFGDGSGGVPEVRICLSSEGTTDDECATWGYQWETGSVAGNVGANRGHRVVLEATTTNHDAEGGTTTSGTGGSYAFTGLRDGVYDITAHSTSTYRVLGSATQNNLIVYHDETTDDEDTTSVGTAGRDSAEWNTRQQGLKIMGYIGNDENTDKKNRGDEAIAGITVRLTGGGPAQSTTTDKYGFYEFTGLEAETRYTVTPSSTSTYDINRGFNSRTKRFTTSAARILADEYPALEEGDFDLPYWNYTTNVATYTSVTVSDDNRSATLINFVLLYENGEIEGGVNNMSGSAGGIDILFTNELTDVTSEATTNSRGEFGYRGLLEGTYSVEIEDAGWAVPCLTRAGGTPDDDGPMNSDGSCRFPAPSTISGSLRGNEDYESMGDLHVYSEKASDNDQVSTSAVRVRGRTQGTSAASFDTAVSWRTGWSRLTDSETTTNSSSLGTISWKSQSVSFSGLRAPTGGRIEIKKGSTTCTTCTLDFNKTGSRDSTKVKETTLTVTAFAANGYDDHVYTLKVGRAAPISAMLEAEDVMRVNSDGEDTDTTARGGAGTSVSRAWSLQTATETATRTDVRIILETLGDPDEDNAYCAQSVFVTEYNDDDKLTPRPDEDDDICEDTRFRLSAETLYEVHVTSEDGVEEVYYLEVKQKEEVISNDATLDDLGVDPGTLSPAFNSATMDYTVDVAHDVESVEVTFSTTDDEATTDLESPYTQDLAGAGTSTTVTITVTAADEETEEEYEVEIRRAAPPADDPAIVLMQGGDRVSAFDVQEGDTGKYTVELATAPTEDVTVTITGGAGVTVQDTVGGGLTTMTFTTTTWDTAQHVWLITAADEDAEEGDPVEVAHVATTVDTSTAYHELEADLAVTITETDTKGVNISAAAKEVAEGSSDATYNVVLNSQPVGTSTVVSVTGTPSGVEVSPALLTFTTANWADAQDVTISSDENNDTASHATFDLDHNAVGGGYDDVEADDINVRVMDNEAVGVVIGTTDVTIMENTTVVYNIRLTQLPAQDSTGSDHETVTVRLIYSSADFTVTNGGVAELTSANWEAGVNLTVTPVAVSADKTRTLTHQVTNDPGTGTVPKYGSANASSIRITVTDVPDDS